MVLLPDDEAVRSNKISKRNAASDNFLDSYENTWDDISGERCKSLQAPNCN